MERLGQGASGVTWKAWEVEAKRWVALKEMILRGPPGSKERELVLREIQLLQQLSHPRVPRYLHHFTQSQGRYQALYLVQEFIEGDTLEALARGTRYREKDVRALMTELAQLLKGLHSLSPPVIHRDIKPANLMVRSDDSALFLIDFGSVRDALKGDLGGSTVAGTFGYMPPEQLVGDATPSTDLYALGVVAVELLTKRSPQSMLDHAHRLKWQPFAEVSPGLSHILNQLVEPDPALRFATAQELLKALSALEAGAFAPAEETTEAAAPGSVSQLKRFLRAVIVTTLTFSLASDYFFGAPPWEILSLISIGPRVSEGLEGVNLRELGASVVNTQGIQLDKVRASFEKESVEVDVKFGPDGLVESVLFDRSVPDSQLALVDALEDGSLASLRIPATGSIIDRKVVLGWDPSTLSLGSAHPTLTTEGFFPDIPLEGVSEDILNTLRPQSPACTLYVDDQGRLDWLMWNEGVPPLLRYIIEPYIFQASSFSMLGEGSHTLVFDVFNETSGIRLKSPEGTWEVFK